jgi:hypothetical protein
MNTRKDKCYNVVNGWNKWGILKFQPSYTDIIIYYLFASPIKYKFNFNKDNIKESFSFLQWMISITNLLNWINSK